jgi:hypothetical protein
MTTLKRIRKYRIELRENDHAPAHIHVVGVDVNISINLHTFMIAGDLPKALKSEVMEYVTTNQTELLALWDSIHPTKR